MTIARKLTGLKHDLMNPISITEADIREELECHLMLRTQENVSSGMAEDAARVDAEERFGDFDRSFRECRTAALGIRIWLQRLQLAVIFALGSAVVWLTCVVWGMQARHQSELSTLQLKLKTNREEATVGFQPAAGVIDNRIPFLVWGLPETTSTTIASWNAEHDAPTLTAPWCDWSALLENH